MPAGSAPASRPRHIRANPSEELCAAGPLRLDPGLTRQAPIALSVVVPTLNEAANVGPFVRSLHAILAAHLGSSFEILIVDDDSPDGTCNLAGELSRSLTCVRVLRRRGERGLASAVIRGWQASQGEILATINADFQHPPEVLGRMLALAPSTDLVVASRYHGTGDCGDWGVLRRLSSRGAYLLGRIVLPAVFKRVTDPLSGCYVVHRRVVAGLEFRPSGYKTLIEILARARIASIGECGYSFRKRAAGRSKASPAESWRYLRHLIRLRRVCRGS